jgi:hypothetical protein
MPTSIGTIVGTPPGPAIGTPITLNPGGTEPAGIIGIIWGAGIPITGMPGIPIIGTP